MPIPLENLVKGEIYFGQHVPSNEYYFFRYLGQGKWSSGKTSLHPKERISLSVYPINTFNVLPLWHVLSFPPLNIEWNSTTAAIENGVEPLNVIPAYLMEDIMAPIPKPPSKSKKKYLVINASRTDNTEAVFREF
jgi:hypothetical protein